MATETPHTAAPPARRAPARDPQIIIYSHSNLLYWWVVWAVGYLMALLTWLNPVSARIGATTDLFSPGNDLGVIYALVVVLVLLLTNTKVRGWSSALVVAVAAFVVLLFANLDWWGEILPWFGNRSVHMNLGFYLFFSTTLLVVWAAVVFGFDRLSFWRVRPGQVTHEFLLGTVDRSFDTENMIFTKRQNDFFRHWLLGLGAGDLCLQTMGGLGREVEVTNVLFVSFKVRAVQRMIATKPDVAAKA
jgi:hypothetical protein